MRLRKRKTREIELGGQDSFLDLVSNIVGILIILVMVAGIRAQYSAANIPDPSQPIADPQTLADLDTDFQKMQEKESAVATLRQNIEDAKNKSQVLAAQIARQSMEYGVLFDQMTSLRADIEIFSEEKSQTDKEKVEYQRQLLEINAKIDEFDKAKNYFTQLRPQVTVLENIPTPLAQTVEDKEIHFRLLGGKIVYVPFMELMNQVHRHVGENRQQFFQKRSIADKVGPIDHFELAFLLRTYDVSMGGEIGTRMEMQYAEFIPQSEPLGEPIREALLSPQSEFRRKLALFRKDIYTLTVWVYPDSFEEYQELKNFLGDSGYTLAARPLAMGRAIGASPYGTKSSTQ